MSSSADEVRSGVEFASAPYCLDADTAEAYRRANHGPRRRRPAGGIHDDNSAANKAGFVAPIAAGEQVLAVMAQLLVDRFGMGFLSGGRIEIAFVKPVLFGDTIVAHARIELERSSDTHLELAIRVENQRGENVLLGTAAVRTSTA
ncbi:MAG TPA: MaoC family dehydratase [Candidatus Binataceae bacterium]|jgi:acyl dehydratase